MSVLVVVGDIWERCFIPIHPSHLSLTDVTVEDVLNNEEKR